MRIRRKEQRKDADHYGLSIIIEKFLVMIWEFFYALQCRKEFFFLHIDEMQNLMIQNIIELNSKKCDDLQQLNYSRHQQKLLNKPTNNSLSS